MHGRCHSFRSYPARLMHSRAQWPAYAEVTATNTVTLLLTLLLGLRTAAATASAEKAKRTLPYHRVSRSDVYDNTRYTNCTYIMIATIKASKGCAVVFLVLYSIMRCIVNRQLLLIYFNFPLIYIG